MNSVLEPAMDVDEGAITAEQDPRLTKALSGRRVLHLGKFYPPHFGGMETHLQALANELSHVLDVHVLVANDGRETVVETIGRVNLTRVGTSFNFAAAPVCPSMIRKINETEADIVQIHLPNPTAILAYLASKHRGRLIVSYHSDVIRQKFLDRAFWPFLRQTLDKADVIVAGSPNYIESSAALRQFRDKCRIVPYAIPIKHFQERDEDAILKIRERFGPRIVLGVGRLVYYKGFEFLIEAMKQVSAHLLIIGDGPLRSALESKAQQLGVSDSVNILTDVDDTRAYYSSADVFVLPSIARSEAFGIVQLEAMASGVPVVNTSLDSGVTFASIDGETGLTVPPRDSNALANAINSLLDDPSRRAKFGAAGKQRVEKEFSLENMTRKTLELYGEVLGLYKPGEVLQGGNAGEQAVP